MHPPLDPAQPHQPPMDQIVMTPGDRCNCVSFGLPNCARVNQDHLKSRGFDADSKLERARAISNRLDKEPNSLKRKQLHWIVHSALSFGPMERGERGRLPSCVEAIVRRLYPETSGLYMGFRDANCSMK